MAKFNLEEFGYEVEIGKFATQAAGAAWFKHGGTVVFAAVTSQPSKEFPGFLPLTVDYRELFSAVGKIPGGYLKREGKFSDKEVLTSRLIDRAIRPLFAAKFFDQVQVLSTVYSVDKIHMPNAISLLATSIALVVSNIPFLAPVGVVEVARVDGQWVFMPTYEQYNASDVNLIIAGTEEGICMLEGSSNNITEDELLDIIFQAHEKIKKQVAWQREIQKAVGAPKDESIDTFNWTAWETKVSDYLTYDRLKSVFKADKTERSEARKKLTEEFLEINKEEIETNKLPLNKIDYTFGDIMKSKMTDLILDEGKRIDGRNYEQVRDIKVEVGLLPCTHGSALFQRGGTQALVTVTLGSAQDAQKVEHLVGEYTGNPFMLQYNFPSYSVGEVRQNRGPGRREIGHGFLAASALKYALPKSVDFPYTMRIVADMLASDGSTSMATVCGSTMALMNAGVPIKEMISGVAMGLLKSGNKFQAITDITGFEDEFGWMDFKVTGTQDAITAIQLDIKSKAGLPREVFKEALRQAKDGRTHILNEMRKVMSAPNPELSPLVPKIATFKIDADKIGAVIGTGGKKIREIIEKTKTNIDIANDGTVSVFGELPENVDVAIHWVKVLAGQIEVGTIFTGKIKRIADFGLFVELVPGEDGLVHISAVPKEKQRNLSQEYKIDQEVTCEIMDYDPSTGRIRLRLV
ncbi:MAG: polyribonucleotide nucleotidyltransferase [Candidatus Babeliales bacterium]|nr:polyribonucleotide nucleotidyltransferase [Candidatus Babeliales bacterium]